MSGSVEREQFTAKKLQITHKGNTKERKANVKGRRVANERKGRGSMTWQKLFEIPPKPRDSIDIAISLSLSLSFNETDSLHIPLSLSLRSSLQTPFPSFPHKHTHSKPISKPHHTNLTISHTQFFSPHISLSHSFLIFFFLLQTLEFYRLTPNLSAAPSILLPFLRPFFL